MKTFLLGVGAQKAGTTWLYDYLAGSPQADFGFLKEYHIFDTLTLPEFANFKGRIARLAIQTLRRGPKQWIGDGTVVRPAFLSDPEMYFDYFARLLRPDHIKLTGDITPSYSGLSEQTLRMIKAGFESRGIAVRPVFLMRDPVDRLQSMIRMQIRDKGLEASHALEYSMMHEKVERAEALLRSDYAFTVNAVDRAFGSEAYFEFYERLFTDGSIRRLCDYLGIDWRNPNFGVRKNESRTDNDLSPEERAEFGRKFKKVYAFCRERFGHGTIDLLWNPPEFGLGANGGDDDDAEVPAIAPGTRPVAVTKDTAEGVQAVPPLETDPESDADLPYEAVQKFRAN